MTIQQTLFVLSLRLRLGLLASAVRLQWRSLSQIRLFLLCILSGLAGVVCTLGLVTLAEVLACWPTTSCWSALTALG